MNHKILLQVTAPTLLVGLILLGGCAVGFWSIQRLQDNLARIQSDTLPGLEASQELEIRLRQLRHHTFVYLIDPVPARLDRVHDDERGFEDALALARSSARGADETDLVRQIEEGYQSYQKDMAALRDDAVRHGPRTDFQNLSDTHPIRQLVEPCHELWRVTKEKLKRNGEESDRVSAQARWTMLALALGGTVGGLLCGFALVRGLTRSIAQLSVRVRDAAQHLDGPTPTDDAVIDVGAVTLTADDDLGRLDERLRHVVRRVEEVTDRLRRQHADMRRAEQLAAVGTLAAGVAHEVRNPLTGMKLLVEAALRNGVARQPLTDEDLRVIHGEIVRLEETVQNFLTFARPPALKRAPCDLRDAVARSADLIRARARQQGVELNVSVPEHPCPASLDAGQFGTVLVNLFLNALDAMPRGGRLTAELNAEGDAWRLRVSDTGTGLAADVMDRLFTPFVSTKPGGTGLGLSLSRRVVEEHGGRITAANRPEGGACFTIALPREEVMAAV
jgi:two-component system, NtrC family, sensor histidine kinase HydH